MDADISTIYQSGFYRIVDFRCRCTNCQRSKPEYAKAFSVSFVRRGNFLFNVFRNSMDSYTGCVLETKPGYEHTVKDTHSVPDECTIFEFKDDFYRGLIDQYGALRFFCDADLHSTLVKTSPETELLHYQIVRLAYTGSPRLEIDGLVISLLQKILSSVSDYQPGDRIDTRLKARHLATIEIAKHYIVENFTDDISLTDIAGHCYVSPFHFSRLFKTFTGYSPHQFLLITRLQQAAILLRHTSQPVTDIAFSCGFNGVEHFTAAFRQHYQLPPAAFRTNTADYGKMSKIS